MGILCSRQAWARAHSSSAAINKGKYASLDQDGADYLQSGQLTVASGAMCTCSTSGLSPEGQTMFILNSVLDKGKNIRKQHSCTSRCENLCKYLTPKCKKAC